MNIDIFEIFPVFCSNFRKGEDSHFEFPTVMVRGLLAYARRIISRRGVFMVTLHLQVFLVIGD